VFLLGCVWGVACGVVWRGVVWFGGQPVTPGLPPLPPPPHDTSILRMPHGTHRRERPLLHQPRHHLALRRAHVPTRPVTPLLLLLAAAAEEGEQALVEEQRRPPVRHADEGGDKGAGGRALLWDVVVVVCVCEGDSGDEYIMTDTHRHLTRITRRRRAQTHAPAAPGGVGGPHRAAGSAPGLAGRRPYL
jgi:hypothetical protein